METIDTLPVSGLETPLREILSPLRSAALDAVEDLMYEAFKELGAWLVRTSRDTGKSITFNKQVDGLTPMLLKQIYDHSTDGSLDTWLQDNAARDRYRRISDFLDLYHLQLDGFKTRFPNAFLKWTPEEDAELLQQYHTAKESGGKMPWTRLEKDFGRNENGLKLRLARLGVDLGEQAGRPRRR